MSNINVKLDGKAKKVVTKTANIGGDTPTPVAGGVNPIELTVGSNVTISPKKLKELLINKGFDVDETGNYPTIIFGLCDSEYDSQCYIGNVDNSNPELRVKFDGQQTGYYEQELPYDCTFAEVLDTIPDMEFQILESVDIVYVIPCLIIRGRINGEIIAFNLTNDDFYQFVTITPSN